ncbi:MAG TPA: hypothetical protein VMT88_03915 [Actinomycetes bacterium]|nr:hypothetical protein [Actinomycetes bacterium]
MLESAVFAALAVYLSMPRHRVPVDPTPRWLGTVGRLRQLRRRGAAFDRRRSVQESDRVIEFTGAVVAELRGGHDAYKTWMRLWPASGLAGPPTSLEFQQEVDVAEVLRTAATAAPGRRGLDRVAACWQVAELSGSGLADGLSYVVESMLHEREVAAEIEGQLAGPRATVRLLTTLPVLALVLGESLGADPLQILLTTAQGWLCLALGLALATLGARWVNRQIHAVWPAPSR